MDDGKEETSVTALRGLQKIELDPEEDYAPKDVRLPAA